MVRTRIPALLALALLLALAALPARSTVIYVDQKAAAPVPDGTSWATAFPKVSQGLAVATAGDEVWVAAATYAEQVVIPPGAALYGGFRGGETTRDQRDWVHNPTILTSSSAQGSGVTLNTSVAVSVLDGFTILGSYNGISATAAAAHIRHNTVANARQHGFTGSGGSDLVIEDNIFRNNAGHGIAAGGLLAIRGNFITGNGGAGISLSNGYTDDTAYTVSGNRISGNLTGGIACSYGFPIIRDNVISGNVGAGGSAIALQGRLASVLNNTILGNTGPDGAVCLSSVSTCLLANNIIAWNQGALAVSGSTQVSIRNNCLFANRGTEFVGLADPTGTAGNVRTDPGIAYVECADIHLQAGSPCIDAGDSSVVSAGETDFEGEPRIQLAGADIGADESDGKSREGIPPPIIRVSPLGSDANDGSSWALAKKTVSEALAALPGGGQVWVAAGVYTGTLKLPPFVYLYGGFSGTESTVTERDWTRHPSVLDGGNYGSVIVVNGGAAYGAVDGFIIRNGNTNVTYQPGGGGIYCPSASLTITHNTFAGNTSSIGGGIYARSAAIIVSNRFLGNKAPTGAGLCASGAATLIADNVFLNNNGPSLSCSNGTRVIHNTVAGNTASTSAAGIDLSGSDLLVANNVVAFNSVGISGNPTTSVVRNNCVFGNSSSDYSGMADPTGTNGNIKADPKLANRLAGDVHILPDSPCLDAGSDADAAAVAVDLDGEARIAGAHADIGADESDGSVPGALPVVRVKPSGDDAYDGASWGHAKRTVQAAVDAVCGTGGEVWVAAGVYPEQIDVGSYTSVLGGFAGTETDRAQRDWTTNRTILDGGGTGTVVTFANCTGAAVDGFTVRNARGAIGSGVYARMAVARVSHCVFNGFTVAYSSGAVLFSYLGSLTVDNSAFTGNNLDAMRIWQGSVSIVNNTIAGNAGRTAIVLDASAVTAINNVIAFNGIGIAAVTYTTATLRNNCVFGNTTDYSAVTDPTGTNGNVRKDPELVDGLGGDLRIPSTSPCVDAGDDAGAGISSTDLAGQPRIRGLHADIGAFETPGPRQYSGQPIIRIKPDGNDANDGSTWAKARRTIQTAVDEVEPGGEVWVAAGVYVERIDLRAGIGIYGGFTGSETTREQRDWTRNASIVDGDKKGTVLSVPPGAGPDTVLDGLTVRNGNVSGAYGSVTNGGAILCDTASPTIRNNTFMANIATYGGGIYINAGSPVVENNVFSDNRASTGSHIYALGGATPLITGNRFTGGISVGSAGSGITIIPSAVYLKSASATLTGNTLTSNAETAIYSASSSPVISGNVLTGNQAGAYCSGGSPIVRNNVFRRNGTATSSSSQFAGGVQCASPTGTVTNSTISGNTFVGNMGTGGAAILLTGGTATVVQNTIVANARATTNTLATTAGISVSGTGGAWTVSGNLIAFNGVYGVQKGSGGTLTLRNNDVYGNNLPSASGNYTGLVDPTGTNGNIKLDPKLASLPLGNAHIQPDSPCVDKGNDADAAGLTQDVDGQARIIGAHVDIGADESDGTQWSLTPPVIYVRPGGDDASDGSSWEKAKKTPQAAVAAADGTEVWVAAGTYVGNVVIWPFTYLYGGFTGTETSRDQRRPAANRTVLDAQRSGTTASFALNVQSYACLDGFTVQNGAATNGGGILCMSGSPTIANCVIHKNTAAVGGGVYLGGAASLRNCVIFRNVAVGLQGPHMSGYVPAAGGGVYAGSGSVIVGNTIVGNSGSAGGAIGAAGVAKMVANNILAYNATGIEDVNAAQFHNNDVFGNVLYNYGASYGTPFELTGQSGNISADPKLAVFPEGNEHVQPGSPCIDAGDSAQALANEQDLDGQPRLQGATVDIGADESDGTSWPAESRRVYLAATGNDASDGLSWPAAKRTLAAALLAGEGGDVWVREGTYTAGVSLPSLTNLYGGFAGTETDLSQRDPAAHVSAVQGDGQTAALTIPVGAMFTAIDGLTITRGAAGIDVGAYSIPKVQNNIITRNGYNGITLAGQTAALIGDNLISHNAANGIEQTTAQTVTGGTPRIVNNRVTANARVGIELEGVSATVLNNVVTDNAEGGVFYGYPNDGDNTTLANNLVAGNMNTCSGHGGLALQGPGVAVGNTVVDNGGLGLSVGAGLTTGTQTVANNIVAFNQSGVAVDQYSAASIRYNCVYGNTKDYVSGDLTGRNGNIRADPLFAARSWGNFHLQPTSPCRDRGDAASVVGTSDLDGQARVQGSRVDMGVDESNGQAQPGSPLVVRVSLGGNDANDGSTWAASKRSVQAALDSAADSGGGQVWVARGRYTGTLVLPGHTALYGGFAGTESDIAQRSHEETVLDGQASGSVIRVLGSGPSHVIDGFVLTGGSGSPVEFYPDLRGGAVYADGASVTVTNNLITGNTGNEGTAIWASNAPFTATGNVIAGNSPNPAWGVPGHMVACSGSDPISVSGNVITDNEGGGILAGYGSAVIRSNIITRNGSTPNDEAIHVAGNARVVDNLVTENGSGIVVFSDPASQTTIANNTIVGNLAPHGAAIEFTCESSSGSDTGSAMVFNNIIAFNVSGIGRGDYSAATPIIQSNDVFQNGEGYHNLAAPPANANLEVDPLFSDRAAGSYWLRPGSPCINAGDNGKVASGETDLVGAQRIQDGQVDLGAYEVAVLDAGILADVLGALRIAGGLAPADGTAVGLLDTDANRRIDVVDAVHLLRRATHLE